ncbi:acyl-CoA synthetase [Pseudonocardia eucalypti]|uniref:Acyl-CoA synthetase n=1 Tax=Pseudonocardia eucalypti TaxID=648755 RepID=A0ABP9R1J6_9PSEU|nr:fatty-acyl-CoA synthase [Pseudonocardia eucalypti]
MFPGTHAAKNPDKLAALLVDTGDQLSYGELDDRSIRLARVFAGAGLRKGDGVAVLSPNDLRFFEVLWAAMRSGLYFTPVNHHLTAEEVAYIVNDSGASALVVSESKRELAEEVAGLVPGLRLRLAYGGEVAGYDDYAQALCGASAEPLGEEPCGAAMMYSSGTTGRPKGVRPPLPDRQVDEPDMLSLVLANGFGLTEDVVYGSPAPIYHAAPLGWCGAVQRLGGTVVMTKKFDPEQLLATIEKYRVTAAQFVPTMFVRMLKLDEDVRTRHDVSSLKLAIHAAAPCPVEVKRKMLDWFGPILVEYYGGTEGNGLTIINTEQWLAKPGSVGKAALGVLHICDDDGNELPVGEIGTVYFEREIVPFTYHNDPEKTRSSQHPEHPTWTTLGDIGRLDEDGFLFLTDRKAFTIISGGVNIYPQEIENALALHPAIIDVAVIGVPDPEMGESVLAFVQPAPGAQPGPELEREIIEFVRSRIARFKAPRAVRFVNDLPRTPTGKLVKGELKRAYLAETGG